MRFFKKNPVALSEIGYEKFWPINRHNNNRCKIIFLRGTFLFLKILPAV